MEASFVEVIATRVVGVGWLLGACLVGATVGCMGHAGAAAPPTSSAPTANTATVVVSGTLTVNGVQVRVTPGSGARVLDALQGVTHDLSLLRGVAGRAGTLGGAQKGIIARELRGAQVGVEQLTTGAGSLSSQAGHLDALADVQADGSGIALSTLALGRAPRYSSREVDTFMLELLGMRD